MITTTTNLCICIYVETWNGERERRTVDKTATCSPETVAGIQHRRELFSAIVAASVLLEVSF